MGKKERLLQINTPVSQVRRGRKILNGRVSSRSSSARRWARYYSSSFTWFLIWLTRFRREFCFFNFLDFPRFDWFSWPVSISCGWKKKIPTPKINEGVMVWRENPLTLGWITFIDEQSQRRWNERPSSDHGFSTTTTTTTTTSKNKKKTTVSNGTGRLITTCLADGNETAFKTHRLRARSMNCRDPAHWKSSPEERQKKNNSMRTNSAQPMGHRHRRDKWRHSLERKKKNKSTARYFYFVGEPTVDSCE